MFQQELVRNANVTGMATSDDKGRSTLSIVVNGQFHHIFPESSRVSKAMSVASVDDIVNRLNGGTFFFINNELIEFRYNDYNGFIHNNDSVAKLMDVVGITADDDEMTGVSANTASRNIKLSKEWASEGFNVPAVDQGDFETAIHYGWSAFSQNVSSAFVLWRLVCANGMRGMTNFLNSQIPLVNNWEEHLDMANRQLMNKINAKMNDRIAALQGERASVADCLLLNSHIADRRQGFQNATDGYALGKLNNIQSIANPVLHLGEIYKSEVFKDNAMASAAPAHISGYDLFNMVTEVRTHTNASSDSTGRSLDMLANNLLFGGTTYDQRPSDVVKSLKAKDAPALIDNDPGRAFWGD